MRGRIVDGVTIITDVYQPPEVPKNRDWIVPILITWAIVAIAIGGLLALAGWGS